MKSCKENGGHNNSELIATDRAASLSKKGLAQAESFTSPTSSSPKWPRNASQPATCVPSPWPLVRWLRCHRSRWVFTHMANIDIAILTLLSSMRVVRKARALPLVRVVRKARALPCAGREEGAGTAACAGSPSNARRIVSSGAPNSSAGADTAACAGRGEGAGTAACARELNAALSFQQCSPYQ